MLRSCQYCGRIHDRKMVCNHKPKKNTNITEADKFRWSSVWHKKREEIKKRDLHLCQICVRELYNTLVKYNINELEVHHNVPINEDYDKRLDNNNLLTICSYHHKMCERGVISRKEVQKIINEQERN